MKTSFHLIGLKKPGCFICSSIGEEHSFEAKSKLSKKQFNRQLHFAKTDELFWQHKWIAVIEHNGFSENGIPLKPLVLDIQQQLEELLSISNALGASPSTEKLKPEYANRLLS